VAAVNYDVRARRFLLRAKNGHRPEIFGALAGQLAAAVAIARLADGLDGIVPVPSSRLAYWRRGFSPANELARGLAGATRVPLLHGVLRRPGLGVPPVKRLGARERWSGVGGRFVHRRAVRGLKILLVDDVLTTGATASACAAALGSAGAVEVRVAVWARTPSPASGFDHRGEARL
jgi:predicted amidophosphoribosyltransferase